MPLLSILLALVSPAHAGDCDATSCPRPHAAPPAVVSPAVTGPVPALDVQGPAHTHTATFALG